MKPRRIAGALAIAAASLAAGCLPYARGYTFLDGAGISHEQEVCGTGPPVWAVMSAGRATVKFALDPGANSRTKLPILRIVAPHGTRIEMVEPTAYMDRDGKRLAVAVRAFSEARNYPDTPQAQRALRMTQAMRRQSGNDFHWYEFAERVPVEGTGRIELPVLVIDGERFELPTLSFEPRASAGFVPLNC